MLYGNGLTGRPHDAVRRRRVRLGGDLENLVVARVLAREVEPVVVVRVVPRTARLRGGAWRAEGRECMAARVWGAPDPRARETRCKRYGWARRRGGKGGGEACAQRACSREEKRVVRGRGRAYVGGVGFGLDLCCALEPRRGLALGRRAGCEEDLARGCGFQGGLRGLERTKWLATSAIVVAVAGSM